MKTNDSRWICGLAVLAAMALCAAQPAFAQKADPMRPEPTEQPPKSDEPIPQGMERLVPALSKTLNLDEKQKEQVRDIVAKHEAAMAELRQEMRIPNDLREKLNSLAKEMAEARNAGDEARAEELLAARTELVKMAAESRAPAQEKMRAVREELHKSLLDVLRPDQHEQFEAIWGRVMTPQGRGRNAPERSPRALKVILDRMEDLTAEQRAYIDTLFAAFRDTSREDQPQRDQQARVKKLYDDVFEVLSDGQKERVERSLRSRRDEARAADAPDAPKNPEEGPPSGAQPPQDKR
jgi:Spy/CpxP family protein refolding chaperone